MVLPVYQMFGTLALANDRLIYALWNQMTFEGLVSHFKYCC